jgi:hypothetical protein
MVEALVFGDELLCDVHHELHGLNSFIRRAIKPMETTKYMIRTMISGDRSFGSRMKVA